MYDQPENVFVAGFIGSPAMNFIQAHLEKENGAYAVVFGSTRLHLSREEIEKAKERGHDPEQYANKEVALGIRPEHMEDAGLEEAAAMAEAEGSNAVEVEAQVIESMGSEKYVYFEPPREQTVHLESVAGMSDDDTEGSEKDIGGGSAEAPGGNLMVARISAQSTAREGEKMRLVIDSSKIHLFDLETEEAIF
jgi:multiple sugar transport system ATP-binding protein